MKNILFLLTLFSLNLNAQNYGLRLFTDNGEKFKIYTNGILNTATATNDVKICGLASDLVKLEVEFNDKTRFERTMSLRMGVIEHHCISRRQDGSFKLTYNSEEEIPVEYASISQVTLVTHKLKRGNDPDKGSRKDKSGKKVSKNKKPCNKPMEEGQFDEFYNKLKSISFEADKLKEAKATIKRHCFSSIQVKTTMEAFQNESTRLDFAKFGYDFVFDKAAYGLVKQGFSYAISGDELDQYLEMKTGNQNP